MVFGPWIETYVWIKGAMPDWSGGWKSKIPHFSFNYITLHYTYMITLTLLGSVIIYAGKNMPYVDALFFASGSATQSGLNTINVNDIMLYQQITIMIVACIANPIFINTVVVFVRLYWFEKRFQHVVLEAQKYRRTRDRASRTKSQAKEDNEQDLEQEERGVAGRMIVVMHPGARTMDVAENKLPKHVKNGQDYHESKDNSKDNSASNSSSELVSDTTANGSAEGADDSAIKRINSEAGDDDDTPVSPMQPPPRAITFADEVDIKPQRRVESDLSQRFPAREGPERHISILEKQRRRDQGSLYIPGPRDFDEGKEPQEIDRDDDGNLVRRETNVETPGNKERPSRDFGYDSGDDDNRQSRRRSIRNKISFDDAGHAVRKARLGMLSKFKRDSKDDDDEDVEKFPETKRPSRRSTKEANSANTLRRRGRTSTFASFMSTREDDPNPLPYLSYQATVGRNSAFVDLTEEQREELGGIEYRALKTLAIVLVCYYVGFHLLGMLCLTPWIARSRQYSNVLRQDGINPIWWGFFTPASLFNDLGLTLTPDSMISFQFAVFPILLGSILIIIGNTGFPCMLRFIIWILAKVTPTGTSLWEEFRFLLDHPRRCFTLLFPSKANWWLFWILVILNGLDLIFFIILDLNDPTVTNLPPGIQVLSGWFQATSTRTAGFSVLNLAELHPGVQVSYLIMMYISIFPIAISIRNTNVYEEKSLGVWQVPTETPDDEDQPARSFVSNHLRRQLSFDLWYVFLGLFVIAIVEGSRLQNTNDYAFTIFSVLFEVVSAYGTVGLSLGYPGVDTSFSAEFHTLSKLVIIAMEIRGRHRGLPYALDKAILLPSEEMQRKEAEDAEKLARARRASNATVDTNLLGRGGGGGVDGNGFGGEAKEKEEGLGAVMPSGNPAGIPGFPRTQTGRSSVSQGGNARKKKNSFANLLGQAFTAGPVRKHD